MWLIVATVSFTIAALSLGVSIVLSIQWDVSKLIKVFFSRGVATSRGGEQTSSLMTTQTLLTDSVSVTKDITEKTTITKEHIGEQVEGEPKPSEDVEIKGNLSKSLNKVKTAFKPKGSSIKKKGLKKQTLADTSFNAEQDENQGNSNPSLTLIYVCGNIRRWQWHVLLSSIIFNKTYIFVIEWTRWLERSRGLS